MARSILEIAREAAERDSTAVPPSSLFNTTNRIARVLRTAASDITRDYLRRSRWQGLSEWHSSWVFALKRGRYAYPLPPDFLRVIPRTEQRNGWTMGMLGPTSPQAWSAYLYGAAVASSAYGWRIRNNAIWVDPTPTSDELVVIEYISRYPVVSLIQPGDIDTSSIPMRVNAPVVSRDGFLTLEDDALVRDMTNGLWDSQASNQGWDVGTWAREPEEILKRLVPLSTTAPRPQVRRPEFVADTDLTAFEDDHILSLGMTWHLQRALAMPYEERQAEYEEELETRIAEDGGGARSFLIGEDCRLPEAYPLQGDYGTGSAKWIVN